MSKQAKKCQEKLDVKEWCDCNMGIYYTSTCRAGVDWEGSFCRAKS